MLYGVHDIQTKGPSAHGPGAAPEQAPPGLSGSPRKLPYTFDPIECGRDALRLANAFRDGKDTLLARPSSMRKRMVSQATSSSHHA
jgi:hypothetical protein